MPIVKEIVPIPRVWRCVAPSPKMTECLDSGGNRRSDVKRVLSPVMCIVAPVSRIMRRSDMVEKR